MRIAKPLLLVTTPIGMIGAAYEGFRLAGGLGFLLLALMLMISAAVGMLVLTIRKEQRAEQAAKESQAAPAPGAQTSTPAISLDNGITPAERP